MSSPTRATSPTLVPTPFLQPRGRGASPKLVTVQVLKVTNSGLSMKDSSVTVTSSYAPRIAEIARQFQTENPGRRIEILATSRSDNQRYTLSSGNMWDPIENYTNITVMFLPPVASSSPS